MKHDQYQIEIGRVIVRGHSTGTLQGSELRDVVARAVAHELEAAQLPGGRTMRDAVVLNVQHPEGGAQGMAQSVASAVVYALGAKGSHG